MGNTAVRPDTGPHVARTRCEETTIGSKSRAWRNRDDRILMALEHELRVAGAGIPELDTTVLGTRQHPAGIGRQSDAENEVLGRY